MSDFFKSIDDFFENSVRIKGKPSWLILCGYAIGETATFCALAAEFKKLHGHEIIIIITPKHQQVVDMYSHNFVKVVVISDEVMRTILRSGYIPQDRFELDQAFSPCWIDRGFRETDGIRFLWKYPGRGGISEMDLARMVLHLPWDSKLEAPRIPNDLENNAINFAISHGVKIGRSVLLCPINNSAPKFPLFFWEEIARLLIEKGLTVFTNMGGLNQFNGLSSMPIKGTIPVNLPIGFVIPFIRLAGNVISGANGMYILIALAEQKNFSMTQLIAYSENSVTGHSSRGFRSDTHPEVGNSIVACFQFLAPELCLNINLSEFLLPFNSNESELMRLANVVVNKDITDSSWINRICSDGESYIVKHKNWLSQLRDCGN
jgi:hypothetical protein